jgi:AcrR family transcriptional regulator
VVRTVKKPAERRKEIMDMAERLFMTSGYEETSVNAIVERLSIAKGTFYHYFSSKEEILGAILERYMDNFAIGLKSIYENTEIEPIEKIKIVLRHLIMPDSQNESLTRNVRDDRDAKLHSALSDKFYNTFKPIVVGVLREGIEKGAFKMKYPEEIAEVLMLGVQGYMHLHIPNFKDKVYAFKKLKALEEIFERVLGLDEGSIMLLNSTI